MLFEPKKEYQEKNDYFENSDEPEVKPAEPKKPVYTPDDPAYWEEESEWEHLKPRFRFRWWVWAAGAFVIVGLIIACWLRYFSPYIEDATQFGYVENIEKRGTVFKTYEGVLLPYKELMDTTRLYRRDFIFTAKNDSLAALLKRAQFASRPVRIGYKQYHATLPWRGASKVIVTSVDSVDPSKILPPEFN